MTDEQLKVSPSPSFPAILECQTSLLFQSEQKKLNEAAFKLDKLSQELESMWSTQGSCEATDSALPEAEAYRKDCPVSIPTVSNMYSLSKSDSKFSEPLPTVSVNRSHSPQPSQAYTPLAPSYRPPSPYGFDPLVPPMLGSQQEPRPQLDRAPSPRPMFYSQQEPRPQLDRAPSPRPMFYSQQEPRPQLDRAPSPRPMFYSQQELRPQLDRGPSPRPMFYSQQELHPQLNLAPSPHPMLPDSPMLYSQQEPRPQPDRAPSPRPGFSPMTPLERPDLSACPHVYSIHESQPSPSDTLEHMCSHQPGAFSPSLSPHPGPYYTIGPFSRVSPSESVQPLFAALSRIPEPHKLPSDTEDGPLGGRGKTGFTLDPGALAISAGDSPKRKKMPSVWAEADLDVAYEKKPSQTPSYENKREQNWNPVRQGGSWRQTDLDMVPGEAAGGRSKAYNSIQIYGTLPKGTVPPSWRSEVAHLQQKRPSLLSSPHSSSPILPSPILARTSLPPGSPRASSIKERKNVLPPLSVLIRPTIVSGRGRFPPAQPAIPSMKRYSQYQHTQEVGRKGPDFPGLPPDSRQSPLPLGEVESEIVSILQPGGETDPESVPRPLSPTRLQPVSLPDTESIRDMEELLEIRAAIPRALKKRSSIDVPVAQRGPTHKRASKYQQLTKLFSRSNQKKQQDQNEGTPSPASTMSPQTSPTADPDTPVTPPTLVLESPNTSPTTMVKRSILKHADWSGSSKKMRARLDPLVVLLDAALLGQLDVVKRVVYEMNDPSQANDEGITALHNAVCGGHYNIVEFLVNFGVNINAPDSHGWTPLHCAASCNDLAICTLLVKKGAAIFAMTLSDGATAAEKCDRYLDGYEECARFLFSAEQQAGMMNSAVVYALWDYEAENSDELSFREGDTITILRRGDKEETNWWWASLFGREGYVPYNLVGLFPRVRPAV